MREFSPFRLDTVNECLWRRSDSRDDQRILLTPKAFAVLLYLVERAGRLVSQNELLGALWPDTFVQPEVLKYLSGTSWATTQRTRSLLRLCPGGDTGL